MTFSTRRRRLRRTAALLSLLGAAVVTQVRPQARRAAPHESAPTISGQAREGNTLTANNGNWANSPASFAYQWQQCDGSGANCNAISGATSKTYKVAAGDVDHDPAGRRDGDQHGRLVDGDSSATDVVSSDKAPVNTAAPQVSGTAKVGEQLSASSGTWTGGVRSYRVPVAALRRERRLLPVRDDATAKVYGVRTVDAGNTMRVVVTATNLAGSTNAVSAATGLVTGSGTTPPPTTHRNHAPTIAYVGLRRVGFRDLCPVPGL